MIHLPLDIHFGVIPRPQQIAALPEGDHLFEIFLAKNAYLHGIETLLALKIVIMA